MGSRSTVVILARARGCEVAAEDSDEAGKAFSSRHDAKSPRRDRTGLLGTNSRSGSTLGFFICFSLPPVLAVQLAPGSSADVTACPEWDRDRSVGRLRLPPFVRVCLCLRPLELAVFLPSRAVARFTESRLLGFSRPYLCNIRAYGSEGFWQKARTGARGRTAASSAGEQTPRESRVRWTSHVRLARRLIYPGRPYA